MHQLRDDEPAFRMNPFGDLAPSRDLPGGIETGRSAIALARRIRLHALGDDQPCGRALTIVERVQRRGRVARAGAAAGHG